MAENRRTFLAGMVAIPIAVQHEITNPTEAQLLGMTQEEYDGSGYAGPDAHQCPVCEVSFKVDDAESIAGPTTQKIVFCPNCGVCQMILDTKEDNDND